MPEQWRSAVAVVALLTAGCSTMSLRTPESRRDFASAVIENWSDYARLQASRLMEEYGPPDRIDYSELAWSGKGPWKEIRVWDVSPYYDDNLGPADLEQTIYFSATPESRRRLQAFSKQLRFSPDGKTLSALGSSEADNFLVLNLADEIASGRATPDEARDFYERTMRLTLAGKFTPYTQRLLFSPFAGPAAR